MGELARAEKQSGAAEDPAIAQPEVIPRERSQLAPCDLHQSKAPAGPLSRINQRVKEAVRQGRKASREAQREQQQRYREMTESL